MKKVIEYIQKNVLIHYLAIIIIGLLVGIPFFWLQIRETHDGFLHLLRLIGLNNSINDSNFPFLIAPYFCRNFGYSMNSFYSPLVTYIPYFIGRFVNSFNVGIKIFAALTISFSGICMYNLMQEITKNKGISFLAAIFYMVFPYRIENIFTRLAIGEFTAFIFIPIVFQGLYNLIHGNKRKHFYIAIGAIGLILSHTISTIFTMLFCIIYILFNIKKFVKKDILIKCCIDGIFILLISAFFLIPMFEYKGQSRYAIFEPDIMKTDGKYTQNNTIELWQLLKDKEEEIGVSFVVGIPAATMFLLSILAYRYVDKEYKDFYIINLLLGCISLLMCTKFFPWLYMPQILNNVQYPWRMIGFAMFFFTPVFAINVYVLIKNIKHEKIQKLIYIIAIIIIGIFTIYKLSGYEVVEKGVDEKYENNIMENPKISHFRVNRDYLPYNALIRQNTYLQEREDRVYVLEGNADIIDEDKKALNLTFDFQNATTNTILELPYFFYPGYTALIECDNEKISLNIEESKNGFLQIKIPEEIANGKVIVEYTGTILEKSSYVVSIVGLIMFIIYIVYEKKKTREVENERKD